MIARLLAVPSAALLVALAGCATTPAATSTTTRTSSQTTVVTPATSTARSEVSESSGGTVAGTYTLAQVKAANSAKKCWAVVDGEVYDLTAWVGEHPGGASRILDNMCGKDGTEAFHARHGADPSAKTRLATFKLGTLAR